MPPKSFIPILLISVFLLSGCGGQTEVKKDYSLLQPADTIISPLFQQKDTINRIFPNDYKIDRDQALQIGYWEAIRLKGVSKNVVVHISEYPLHWSYLYSDTINNSEPAYKYWKQIKDRIFWRLLYLPKSRRSLGGLELFIDAINGEVIYLKIYH